MGRKQPRLAARFPRGAGRSLLSWSVRWCTRALGAADRELLVLRAIVLAGAGFVVWSCVGQRSVSRAPSTPIATQREVDVAPPPAPPKADVQTGFATFYAASFAGRRTANGERYDPGQMTAAHRTLPFGTTVEVTRGDGRKVLVRINDRGPYGADRIIDLSRRAARELGMLKDGKVRVEVRAVR